MAGLAHKRALLPVKVSIHDDEAHANVCAEKGGSVDTKRSESASVIALRIGVIQ
jgi:hypothetical protein